MFTKSPQKEILNTLIYQTLIKPEPKLSPMLQEWAARLLVVLPWEWVRRN